MNQQIKTSLGTIILIIISITIGVFVWKIYSRNPIVVDSASSTAIQKQKSPPKDKLNNNGNAVCTQKTKLCPDGKTYVCKFAECPKDNTRNTIALAGIPKSEWVDYQDKMRGFALKYPKAWGEMRIEDDVFTPDEEEFLDPADRVNITKITLDTEYLSFLDYSDLVIIITDYTKSRYYQIDCYEGVCNLIDLIKQKNDISKNGNAMIGRQKAEISDMFFRPGGSVVRSYVLITGNYKIEARFFHSAENLEGINDETRKTFLEDLIDKESDKKIKDDLEQFVQNADLFMKSFSIN